MSQVFLASHLGTSSAARALSLSICSKGLEFVLANRQSGGVTANKPQLHSLNAVALYRRHLSVGSIQALNPTFRTLPTPPPHQGHNNFPPIPSALNIYSPNQATTFNNCLAMAESDPNDNSAREGNSTVLSVTSSSTKRRVAELRSLGERIQRGGI